MGEIQAHCRLCSNAGPYWNVNFHANIGLLVMRIPREVAGTLCGACIHRQFWKHFFINFFLGWWGVISVCVTPLFLLVNAFYYTNFLFDPVLSKLFSPQRRGVGAAFLYGGGLALCVGMVGGACVRFNGRETQKYADWQARANAMIDGLKTNDVAGARRAGLEALNLAGAMSDKSRRAAMIATTYDCLGLTERTGKNLDAAAWNYRLALSTRTAAGLARSGSQADSKASLGMVLAEKGQSSEAESALRSALAHYTALGRQKDKRALETQATLEHLQQTAAAAH